MTPLTSAILVLAGLLTLGVVVAALCPNPMGTPAGGIFYCLGRAYVRVVHRLRTSGREHLPAGRSPGPMIIVANHTAGIDPVLVSASVPFHIRWMMAEDMRVRWMQWFWNWHKIIFVGGKGDHARRDLEGMREAIRHLKGGGVVGIFPEGGLERPPGQIQPFLKGVGLLIAKGKAPVLPVFIDGTPQGTHAWTSLWRPSRSRIEFDKVIDYRNAGLRAQQITDDLRQHYIDHTGWPANDTDEGAPE